MHFVGEVVFDVIVKWLFNVLVGTEVVYENNLFEELFR